MSIIQDCDSSDVVASSIVIQSNASYKLVTSDLFSQLDSNITYIKSTLNELKPLIDNVRRSARLIRVDMMAISQKFVFLKGFLKNPEELKEAIFKIFPGMITQREWSIYYIRMVILLFSLIVYVICCIIIIICIFIRMPCGLISNRLITGRYFINISNYMDGQILEYLATSS